MTYIQMFTSDGELAAQDVASSLAEFYRRYTANPNAFADVAVYELMTSIDIRLINGSLRGFRVYDDGTTTDLNGVELQVSAPTAIGLLNRYNQVFGFNVKFEEPPAEAEQSADVDEPAPGDHADDPSGIN